MDLRGIKMAVIGDSITEGVGVEDLNNLYFRRIEREYGMRDVYADGISGSRIARQKYPSAEPRWDIDFLSRVEKIDEDCDLVIVFGGTNDFGHGDAPLGTPEDYTPFTFWGACNMICEMLLTRFPKSQLVFMGALHRSTENVPTGDDKPEPVATLYEYMDILRTVTRKYSIPFLDLMQVSGITPRVPILQEMYMPDGIHPNDAGHALIAAKLKGFLETL
jgi:lysophospholipase L1-like esterase